MKLSEVEIYSDATNMAVMRHPSRNFPGVLIQGDSLHRLLSELAVVLAEKGTLSEEAAAELEGIHEELSEKLSHYTKVLQAHGLELPFHVGG